MAVVMELYEIPASPPCRAVKMVAHLLGIKFKLHEVDLLNGKHLEPEFLQVNPFHKVPVINDGGFILCESNAIMRYLVNKYSPKSPLYPQDPQKRAVVDQWLSLSSSTYFASGAKIMHALLFRGEKPAEADIAQAKECLEILNTKMDSTTYLTGDDITLADIALTASLSEYVMACFDMTDYPDVVKYISRMRSRLSPIYAEINDEPEAQIKKMVQDMKQKIAAKV